MYKNKIKEREILTPTKAFSVRSFISVLDEISCGFAVSGDFFNGFSVSNRPLRKSSIICLLGKRRNFNLSFVAFKSGRKKEYCE